MNERGATAGGWSSDRQNWIFLILTMGIGCGVANCAFLDVEQTFLHTKKKTTTNSRNIPWYIHDSAPLSVYVTPLITQEFEEASEFSASARRLRPSCSLLVRVRPSAGSIGPSDSNRRFALRSDAATTAAAAATVEETTAVSLFSSSTSRASSRSAASFAPPPPNPEGGTSLSSSPSFPASVFLYNGFLADPPSPAAAAAAVPVGRGKLNPLRLSLHSSLTTEPPSSLTTAPGFLYRASGIGVTVVSPSFRTKTTSLAV